MRSLDQQEKKFIEAMLAKAEKKDMPVAQKKNDVDISEVEKITQSIQRRIQRGE